MKPTDEIKPCEFEALPSWADRQKIVDRFNWVTGIPGTLYGISVGYTTSGEYKNNISIGYLLHHTDSEGNNYRDINYRFNIYEGGILVGAGCVKAGGYVAYFPFTPPKKKGKPQDRVFALEFLDYPEVTYLYGFVIYKK